MIPVGRFSMPACRRTKVEAKSIAGDCPGVATRGFSGECLITDTRTVMREVIALIGVLSDLVMSKCLQVAHAIDTKGLAELGEHILAELLHDRLSS
jgi:hypothetical protein